MSNYPHQPPCRKKNKKGGQDQLADDKTAPRAADSTLVVPNCSFPPHAPTPRGAPPPRNNMGGSCFALAAPVVVSRVAPRPAPTTSRHHRLLAAPVRAAPRGWGNTDNRFSKLDRRRDDDDGYNNDDERDRRDERRRDDDNGSYQDVERSISFQELRKRQDREQMSREVRAPQQGPAFVWQLLAALLN